MGMHEPPDRSRAVGIIVAIVITALVTGGIVYFWQHGQVKNLQDDLAAAQASSKQAIEQTQAKMTELTKQVAAAQADLKKAQKQAHQTRKQLKQQKQQTQNAQQAAGKLPDGNYFGYLKNVSTNPDQIGVDTAEYLTGKAANKAALADGVIKKGQSVPNDVYIRNTSKQVRTIPTTSSPNVQILAKGGGSPKLHSVSYSDFAKLFNSGGKKYKHLHVNGYHIVISNGKVTSIKEQFQP